MNYKGENLRLYNELIEKHYSGVGAMDMAKTDNPITTAAPDAYRFNAVYGAAVFQQLQTASVLFNALPKYNYSRQGYRARKTRYLIASGSTEATINATQNGAIPDSVASDTALVSVPIKEQAMAIEYSYRMLLLAKTSDDVAMDVAQELEYGKNNFSYLVNKALNTDVTTLASTNMESIDRVVSSYAEVTNCTDLSANDADIYGLDRDAAATFADAYVNHNSGTVRAISKKIVSGLIEQTTRAGALPSDQFFYTGSDTWEQLTLLYDTQIRYAEPTTSGTTPTGETGKAVGASFGKELGTLYGRPVIVAPTGEVVANGDISNLYLLSTQYDPIYKEPSLGIKVLQAPIMAESKLVEYPKHAKLGNEHLIYSAMELECKRFNIQGKARDLAVIA